MTFNPNADVSNNTARRRGRTAAIAGGGIGIGAIAVMLISAFTGVDLTGLLGGGAPGGSTGSSQGTVIENCETGQDANENDDCRIAAASLALDQFWDENLNGYVKPSLTIVDGSTPTQCGTASNAVGPFYCPPEQGVYLDPTFFQILRQQFGASAGSLSQLYILAHEYGHHVQNLMGTMEAYPNNGTGPMSNGVRMELQADCYAGAWVGAMTEQEDASGQPYLKPPTEQELTDAINAAMVVGDDHIQQQSGFVNPESFTHGTSEQRARWFATGYKYGLGQCDAFATDDLG